ncbi:MAG: DUF3892 domain-containing protein [Caldilineae bacterium]|nr:DUF3892 domain-containing protein [Caldilineae bacterium]
MDEIPVRVKLWRLFCFHGADEEASEPYMWVIGFKFDGSTMKQALARFNWTPDYFFSQGSHGCLGTRNVRPGAKISIPANVGTWETTIKPIKLTDAQGNSTDVPGAVGFAAVVLEENNVPDDAAEAGHQALNNFVANTLESFVTGINLLEFNQAVQDRVNNGAARDKAIEDELRARFDVVQQTISDGASDVVSQAMRNAMNLPELAWAGIDKDQVMGRAFHLATAAQLINEGDFTLDFDDNLFDNPALPEAGDFAYTLHSLIKARVKWRAIPSQLPAEHDIQIQGISRGFSRDRKSYYIANVGGVVNGNSWWMGRSDACGMIQDGRKAFYVLDGDGSHTPVSVVSPPDSHWSYLTTPADDHPGNNLLSLPKYYELPGFHSAVLEPDPFG